MYVSFVILTSVSIEIVIIRVAISALLYFAFISYKRIIWNTNKVSNNFFYQNIDINGFDQNTPQNCGDNWWSTYLKDYKKVQNHLNLDFTMFSLFCRVKFYPIPVLLLASYLNILVPLYAVHYLGMVILSLVLSEMFLKYYITFYCNPTILGKASIVVNITIPGFGAVASTLGFTVCHLT